MDQNTNPENQYIITEQGDLGLGTRQLNNDEQKHVDEQRKAQQQNPSR